MKFLFLMLIAMAWVNENQATSDGCHDRYGKTRCEYYQHIGWCRKLSSIKRNCRNTCVCLGGVSKVIDCRKSAWGCCNDKKTKKQDAIGLNCPDCADDSRFKVLCDRFAKECAGSAPIVKSMRKYCPKTCNICVKDKTDVPVESIAP
uniref:ShKT domain-containing protein n=1 Tax=Clytia hemisphaerica TaxID=252671 RepID=A0A7M6DRC2_9CNID